MSEMLVLLNECKLRVQHCRELDPHTADKTDKKLFKGT